MIPALIFAPLGVAIVSLGGRAFPDGDQAWSRMAAGLGVIFVAPLPFVDASWRAVTAATPDVIGITAGVVAAWILVLARPGRPAWRTTALTGVAASAALLAALSDWTVPALLFLGCAALACWADSAARGAYGAGLVLVAGVTALGSGVALARDGAWAFPTEASGTGLWLILAGTGLLLGAAYLVTSTRPDGVAPLLPLVALSMLLVSRVLDGARPLIAVGVVTAGLLATIGLTMRGRPSVVIWVGTISVGAMLVDPAAGVAAAVALVLALVAAALAGAPNSPEPLLKAAVATFLPLTAGFVLVAAAVLRAFERVVDAPDAAAAAPWMAATAAILVAMGVGLWLAVGLAGAAGAARPVGSVGPAAVAAAAVAVAAFPRATLGLERSPLGAEGGVLLLHAFALAAGGGAAWFVYSREDATISLVGESVGEPVDRYPDTFSEPRSLQAAALVVAAVAVAGLVGLTIEGLRLGFL